MKSIKFSCKAARDIFTKDLKKEEFKILSDSEVEVAMADVPKRTENDACSYADLYSMASSMRQEMNWHRQAMAAEMQYHRDQFYDHVKGHLPPIHSAEQMKRAVAALGMDKEYDVQKRVVFASSGGELLLDFKKK